MKEIIMFQIFYLFFTFVSLFSCLFSSHNQENSPTLKSCHNLYKQMNSTNDDASKKDLKQAYNKRCSLYNVCLHKFRLKQTIFGPCTPEIR